MFCNWCGAAAVGNEVRFCSKCGRRLSTIYFGQAGVPPPPIQSLQAPGPVHGPVATVPNFSVEDNETFPRVCIAVQVRGYLLLFCVGSTVLFPAACCLDAINLLTSVRPLIASDSLLLITVLVMLGIAILSVAAGAAVWSNKSARLAVVRVLLVATFAAALLVGASQAIQQIDVQRANEIRLAVDDPPMVNMPEAGAPIAIGWAIGWFLYFRHSRRVEESFGSNL